ncbi:hypothetical protein [Dyella silvatica]|uniref:hypothetical protein n=1 Tax=Dyella silvatica TaxID=2992128 RepID=UPI00225B73B9|nr:hypothetical protein [Dyella silvatica]
MKNSVGLFSSTVGDDGEHKFFTADICYDNKIVALISQDKGLGDLELEIYPNPDGGPWTFSMSEFIDAINIAKSKMLNIS